MKAFSKPTVLVALFSLAACSGGAGTMNSSVPAGSQQPQAVAQSAQATAQTQTRTTLSHDRTSRTQKDGSGENGNENFESGDDGHGTVVYSSLPAPLKAVSSVGFQADQASEFGDGVNLTQRGNLQRVRYVLSSWGCQSGNWYSDNCVTAHGATFPVPITLNVYAIDTTKSSSVGALLATQTQTFNIPYRPSADNVRCTGAFLGEFYSSVDASCVNGLANVIVFDFSGPSVNLPLQSIFSLAYNTTTWGYSPIGNQPCDSTLAGCPYDSLNVSADGPGGPIGSAFDPNGIFWNTSTASNYCDNGAGGLIFRLDTPCWTGYHPQFEVRAQVGNNGHDNGHDNRHDNGHDN